MDYELVVIGAGPGGYVAAIQAAQLGMKTALIEKEPVLGGTCLNVGCIPSKSLLHATERYYEAKHHFHDLGIDFDGLRLDFSAMQKKKQEVIETFRSGLKGLMKKNRVEVIHSTASFLDAQTIVLSNGETVRFQFAIIATGSSPLALPFLPFDEKKILSSTGLLDLQEVPKKLGIIGAGVIGVELGSVYSRIGSDVTVIEFLDQIVPTCDEELSKAFQKILEQQGMKFHLSARVVRHEKIGDQVELTYEKENQTKKEKFDQVLVSVGRRPNTESLSLTQAGIETDEKGWIRVNEQLQTTCPNVYAIGDVIGQPMLAHKASDEGICVVKSIRGIQTQLNLFAIPNVIYTQPEVAYCGLTEKEANEKVKGAFAVRFPMKANSRAKAVQADLGWIKLVVHPAGYLLGAHLLTAQAGELIQPLIVCVQEKIPLKRYLEVPHAHPTLSEAVKEAVMAAVGKSIHS